MGTCSYYSLWPCTWRERSLAHTGAAINTSWQQREEDVLGYCVLMMILESMKVPAEEEECLQYLLMVCSEDESIADTPSLTFT